jgi:hypothetical protein
MKTPHNAVSRKVDNHRAALALYFSHDNFCRVRKKVRTSPAQAASLTSELPGMESLCAIMDAPATKRGPYRKRVA